MQLALLYLIVFTLYAGGFFLNNDFLATFVIFGALIIQSYIFLVARKKILIYCHLISILAMCYLVYARFSFDQFLLSLVIIGLINLLMHVHRIEIKELMFRKTKIRGTLSKEYQNLIEKYDMVKELSNELGVKSIEIVDMYEIAKIMSLSIRYSGIMKILERYLNENFYFTNASILFINQVGEHFMIDKTQRFRMEDKTDFRGEDPEFNAQNSLRVNQVDEEILKTCRNSRKPIFIEKGKSDDYWEGILASRKIKNLYIVPATVSGELRYIMYIENIQQGQERKFQILVDQSVLELEKVKLYEQVEKLAITDSLTGLYVKRHFEERARGEMERVKANNLDLACLMLDMDHFKDCNDTYGHLMGDVVLKNTAEIIKNNTRELDIVARYGGEEFLMFLPETDLEGAKNVAERIRRGVETYEYTAFNQMSRNTISIGISRYPMGGETLDDLIENSDKALYRAKMLGRNRVCIFGSEEALNRES